MYNLLRKKDYSIQKIYNNINYCITYDVNREKIDQIKETQIMKILVKE